MKRRDFIKQAAVGTAAAVAAPAVIAAPKKIRWRMPTSWPKAFDLIYGGAADIA
ncbi:MAG: twin-arginine translocation signal domain-containing protein, partial [Gammaproteobacteria bacterium]|nr:twin-arginine translocation signal domain-containing protein [Gammaproteobacteria bacterium]